MNRLPAWIALVLAACLPGVEPRPPQPWPVPADARVTIAFDKPWHYLGDQILAHFTVTNQGRDSFFIETGGDNRNTVRATKFTVVGTAFDNLSLRDPWPEFASFGGWGGMITVPPGSSAVFSLPLHRYLRFDSPGVHRIRISHPLGWTAEPGRPIPIAEADLEMREPDADQAEDLMMEIEHLPAYDGGRMGVRTPRHAVFDTFAYPVYLPLLRRRLVAGDERFVASLDNQTVPEAMTMALDLLENGPEVLQAPLAHLATHRLPQGQWLRGLHSTASPDQRRLWLSTTSWRPEHAARLLTWARTHVIDATTERAEIAARILLSLGEANDLPLVTGILGRALSALDEQPSHGDGIIRQRMACADMEGIAVVLLDLGAQPPDGDGLGETAVRCLAMQRHPGALPADQQRALAALLDHPFAYLREAALRASRRVPVPPTVHFRLAALLDDGDNHVAIAAAEVAMLVRDPVLRPILARRVGIAADATDVDLEALRATALHAMVAGGAHAMVPSAMVKAFARQGIDATACRALVARLADDSPPFEVMAQLVEAVCGNHALSLRHDRTLLPAERLRITAAWRQLVEERAGDVDLGAIMDADDPALRGDLVLNLRWWDRRGLQHDGPP